MSENLLTVFTHEDLDPNEITSMSMGRNSKTGKAFARATMSSGRSYVQTLSQAGVKEGKVIEIPPFSNREERRTVVKDLHKSGYTQDEIADFCGISQSTVHNDLKKGCNKDGQKTKKRRSRINVIQ